CSPAMAGLRLPGSCFRSMPATCCRAFKQGCRALRPKGRSDRLTPHNESGSFWLKRSGNHNCGGVLANPQVMPRRLHDTRRVGKALRNSLSAIDTFDGDSVRSRLLTYLRGQVGGDVEIGQLKRYTVGFSWLTFGFNAKWSEGGSRIERDLILRLGPPSGIFAPYRATPEFLTLQSLAGSGVPVPRAYWCCDDNDVL